MTTRYALEGYCSELSLAEWFNDVRESPVESPFSECCMEPAKIVGFYTGDLPSSSTAMYRCQGCGKPCLILKSAAP